MKDIKKARKAKEELISILEKFEASSSKSKRELNTLIRDLEEEIHRLEAEKLSEYNPERN